MKSQYVLERDARVAKNKDFIVALGLKILHDDFIDSVRPLRPSRLSCEPRSVPFSAMDRTHLKRAATTLATSFCESSPSKRSTKFQAPIGRSYALLPLLPKKDLVSNRKIN